MSRGLAPDPERLVSIPVFAALRGEHRVTAYRTVKRLHAADRARHRGGWLIACGPRLKINLSYLKREHPELFGVRVHTPGEFDAVVESVTVLANRLGEVESLQEEETKTVSAVVEAVRRMKGELARLRSVASGCARTGTPRVG